MKSLGSVAAVVAAIHEEADAEVQRIERETAASLERSRRAGASDVVRVADAAPRLAAARQQAQERLARAQWESRRETLEARETWIAAVRAEGDRLLGTQPDPERRDTLCALAVEALVHVPGDEAVLAVAAGDAAILDRAARDRIALEARKRTVDVWPADLEGGCVASTPDGKVTFDNSLEARAQRFEAEWRAALGRLYAETTGSEVVSDLSSAPDPSVAAG